jgi:hypothetical protein
MIEYTHDAWGALRRSFRPVGIAAVLAAMLMVLLGQVG